MPSTTVTVAPTTTTSTIPALALPAQAERVGIRTFDWIDRTRATPPNGNYRGRSWRELVTTIWYPTPGPTSTYVHWGATPDRTLGALPVILLAHGHGGEPADYQDDAMNWAERGYVVVAPAFPLSRRHAVGGPSYADLANQPGDLSFVLDQMLAGNADPGSWLYGLVDARRIAAVGHSMGAWTVLALVANSCCRDGRVRAAAVLAGEMAPGFTTPFYRSHTPPILFVHARDDDIVPYAAGARAYASDRAAPKYLLTVASGGHITPYFGPKTPVGAAVIQVVDEFLNHYVRRISAVSIFSPDHALATLQSRLARS